MILGFAEEWRSGSAARWGWSGRSGGAKPGRRRRHFGAMRLRVRGAVLRRARLLFGPCGWLVERFRREGIHCDLPELRSPISPAAERCFPAPVRPLQRDGFFEGHNGNARLMGSFAVRPGREISHGPEAEARRAKTQR